MEYIAILKGLARITNVALLVRPMVHMSHLVLLISEVFPARLAALPYLLHSNVTKLQDNLLTKPSVFYYLPIVSCNLVLIKLFLLL